MLKGYLTTGEAAERLGISGARIRRMILDGAISGVEKLGQSNLIPEKEIKRLENSDRKPGRPANPRKTKKQ